MKRTINALLIALLAVAAASAALIGCTTASASDAPARGYEFRDISDYFAPRVPSGAVRVKQEMDARAAQEAAEAERIAADEAAVQETHEYHETVYYGGNDYGNPFKSQGVAEDGRYSYGWYSQNVLPGGGLDELNANGRHVDDSTGYVVDGDGYIAVAMDGVDKGTIVETPWGEAKVYDRVEGDDAPYTGFVDVYTDF